MKQPELEPNEITLPLIQDGCAVKSPPNLVTMVENGETAQAKFTVRIISPSPLYLYHPTNLCVNCITHGVTLNPGVKISVFRAPCFNSLGMIPPISTVAYESARLAHAHRNVSNSSTGAFRTLYREKKN